MISSSLCNDAFETTTPPTVTGWTFATGVIAPVLPTWITISLIFVTAFSAENLYAIAHLGELEVLPSLFCRDKSFNLYINEKYGTQEINDIVNSILKVEESFKK